NYAGSTSADFTQIVNAVATTTTIMNAVPSPSVFGQTVTFTVIVSPSQGSTPPTGTLTFMDGATTLGTSTSLADAGGIGTATFTTRPRQPGAATHPITAVYAGDITYAGSTSADFTQTVTAAATATTITASDPSPSTFGQPVTFTVTVAPTLGTTLPAGTLTVMDGATTLGVSTSLADAGGFAP